MNNELMPPDPRTNQLLARLPEDELRRLSLHLKLVSLPHKLVLDQVLQPIQYVYFPVRATLSMLTVMENGNAIEVGTIGYEGASGLTALLGSSLSLHRLVVQIPGQGFRIGLEQLQREAHHQTRLYELLMIHQIYFLAQASQSVACNGLHPIQMRCCRWLLMTHDRTGSNAVPLTHEFLAVMLGVRRAGVTEVLKSLADQGLVRCRRGEITIIDRAGLEEVSCECYRAVTDHYKRLLG